jgi:branched-chain amino acid aminotransferase
MAFAVTGKIWMNGSLVDWKDATLHVASHVIHYGTGVFEGLRAYDSKTGTNVFRLEPHMRRMIDSCKVNRMEPKWSQQELSLAVLDTVRINGFKSCYIRLIFRGRFADLDPRPARSKPRSSLGGTR